MRWEAEIAGLGRPAQEARASTCEEDTQWLSTERFVKELPHMLADMPALLG